jgi:hypothetical protein
VGVENDVAARDLQVFVDESAEAVSANWPNCGVDRLGSGGVRWWVLLEISVGPVHVVMRGVLA